jgi:hypothetical protein
VKFVNGLPLETNLLGGTQEVFVKPQVAPVLLSITVYSSIKSCSACNFAVIRNLGKQGVVAVYPDRFHLAVHHPLAVLLLFLKSKDRISRLQHTSFPHGEATALKYAFKIKGKFPPFSWAKSKNWWIIC